MAALEEVKKMQEQGMAENEIIQSLQQKGMKYKEISEALAQSKIKAAVEEPTQEEITPESPGMVDSEEPSQLQQGAIPGMQKSMLETPEEMAQIQPREIREQTTEEYAEQTPVEGQAQTTEEYAEQTPVEGQAQTPVGGQYGYPSYEPSMGGVSSDVITEISEQVVSEKISEIRKHLEKVIDFKTTVEAKTEALEERLKRIEKIIDTLQSSVLRKVGDYVTNVDDIKRELIETQKSFSRLVPEIRKKSEKPSKKISEK